jgi:hypothetical protein
VAGILVARHLKTADDLFDNKPSPRTESMVATAVGGADHEEDRQRVWEGVERQACSGPRRDSL